jgi:hypothetical protein
VDDPRPPDPLRGKDPPVPGGGPASMEGTSPMLAAGSGAADDAGTSTVAAA